MLKYSIEINDFRQTGEKTKGRGILTSRHSRPISKEISKSTNISCENRIFPVPHCILGGPGLKVKFTRLAGAQVDLSRYFVLPDPSEKQCRWLHYEDQRREEGPVNQSFLEPVAHMADKAHQFHSQRYTQGSVGASITSNCFDFPN